MKKEELLACVGSMQQLACVRSLTYSEGAAGGLKAYQVHNGPMDFLVLADKCLDIGEFRYKGAGFHFLSKPGLANRAHYDTNGLEARRSIMGGLLFTCGLENICAPCQVNGHDYPMHGRLRSTPAQHLCSDACWKGDDYELSVSGEIREAELFGENMVLRRTITTRFGSKSVTITDRYENQSFRPEPMMLLYHFNFGYPLLESGSKIIIPSKSVKERDDASPVRQESWQHMGLAHPNVREQVYIHKLKTDDDGNSFAAVVNEQLSLGLRIDFHTHTLPYFMQWKTNAAGDYAVGLEPANASVGGRAYHDRNGDVPMLAPQTTQTVRLRLTVLEGEAECSIADLERYK